jgi:PIN domain nuclease of toxin-antitoxin system
MVEDNGFEILPITFEHTLELSTLEYIHRDPFDRLLIAQCKSENLVIVTKDDNIKRYNIRTIW